MGGRGEDVLVGGLCLVLAFIMAKRMWDALQAGEMPLYRTRLRKADVSAGKYKALVAFNAALVVVITAGRGRPVAGAEPARAVRLAKARARR